MSNSTTPLDQIASNQAAKEVVMNALMDAASPATLWGRHASACSGLTWGYYGGSFVDSTATLHAIANGTVTLTASTTNYLYADATTGAVSANTTGFPAGKVPLYSIVTGATTVTSYTDYRSYQPSAVTASGGVTSVGLAAPAEFTVTGSPVTGSGTLTLTKAAQAVNSVWAGPASGGSAAPTFRALVGADIPVMVGSGASHAPGGVPDPGATAGTTRFLREDGTWNVPAGGGGSSTYAGLTDVSLTSLADKQVPSYSASASAWKNKTLSIGPLGNDWLNPADCSSHVTLSNSNLSALLNSAPTTNSLVRGNVGHSSGKWYFEWTCPSTVVTIQGGGVATTADAVDNTSLVGQNDSTGSILRGDGFATAMSSTAGSVGQVANSKIMVAVDIDNGKIWYRIGSGNWNNSGTANPATNVGGISITAGLTYYPVFVWPGSASNTGASSQTTFNFGASAFTNTPPTSGFSPWNANDNIGLQPSDVAVSAPSSGQVLTFNGTNWVNATPSGGGTVNLGSLQVPSGIGRPALSSFAWLNQGTSTVVEHANGPLTMTAAAQTGGDQLRILQQAVPGSTPYTVTAQFNDLRWGDNYYNSFVSLYDSGSGKISAFVVGSSTNGGAQYLEVWHVSGVSGGVTVPKAIALNLGGGPFWLRITNDGTNLTYYTSANGADWVQFYQEVKTVFLPAITHGGWGSDVNYTTATSGEVGSGAMTAQVNLLGFELASGTGTNTTWIAPTGGGSTAWAEKTANYTAASGDVIAANTSAGAFTVTLPASPSAGNTVQIVDEYQTFDINALTINPNGAKIGGLTQNLVMSRAGQFMQLTYKNSTVGWIADGGITPPIGTLWNAFDAQPGQFTFDAARVVCTGIGASGSWGSARTLANGARSSGKLYFEFKITTSAAFSPMIGVGASTTPLNNFCGNDASGWGMTLGPNGADLYHSGSFTGQSTYSPGDVCGVAVDFTASTGSIQFYKNNVANGSATGLTLGTLYPMISGLSGGAMGQLGTRAAQCTYSPPSGYSYWDN